MGPPNVGKSTLLNRILGTKVTIVSPKPQTTRNRIAGIYHGDGFQMVFIDTPGIHEPRTILHKSMVASAISVFSEVDIILLMIDAGTSHEKDIISILTNIKKADKPCLLVINKIDIYPKQRLLPVITAYNDRYSFDAIIPISALKGEGIKALLQELKSRLMPGPQFFPTDMKTDQPESFLIAEIIREKIMSHMKNELPYASAVTVDKKEEFADKNLLSILSYIHVETESQKKIMIGNQGRMIKAIGRASRLELEKIFNVRIYLNLQVTIEKHWRKNTRALRRLGY